MLVSLHRVFHTFQGNVSQVTCNTIFALMQIDRCLPDKGTLNFVSFLKKEDVNVLRLISNEFRRKGYI